MRWGQQRGGRSEEHTSELQSPVPISYAVFCLKKKKNKQKQQQQQQQQQQQLIQHNSRWSYTTTLQTAEDAVLALL